MTIPGIKEPAIPFGSVVVISGVSGFIGSHIADQVLAAGFKVRGTTRSAQRTAWAADYFKEKYGNDSFELVEVPTMEADNAFDEVVVGKFRLLRRVGG
ncbi:NAD-dependent epimerase/dehydratase family protein [Candidatus Bathyarchaeota archaeon]|nr:NAD-dependent epimerase/dehydratase family protein [Candidatus Bathyarchaeota archaeon]